MFKKLICAVLASVILMGCWAGCARKTATDGDKVRLVWYLRGSNPKNSDQVFAKANEYSKQKIGVEVDYKFIDPSSYEEKMNLIMSSGEEYDICWTSNWSNSYLDKARDGAFVPLDEYLNDYPALKDTLLDYVWEGSKVDGHNYGVYNNQCLVLPIGWWFNEDLVKKHNIDLSKITKLSDLNKIFDMLKQKEPDVIPAFYGDADVAMNSELGFVENIGGFLFDEETMKLGEYKNVSEQRIKYCKLMREWYLNGFFPPDISTISEADIGIIKAGKVFSGYTSYKPGAEAEISQTYGFPVSIITLAMPKSPSDPIGTLNAISSTSKHIKESLELLQLINTDKYFYNLLQFGIEGQDYEFIDKENEVIKVIPDSYRVDTFLLGNQLNMYLLEGKPLDVWEKTKELNESAVIGKQFGFIFDPEKSNVSTQYAQVSAVDSEYYKIIKNGLDDTDKIMKEYKEKLKKAGIDDLRAACQSQLTEYIRTKN